MTTPNAPSPNPLLILLDLVTSPILLFNAEGQVAFSNQAAKQMACRPSVLLGSDPNVRGLVKDIAAGKTVLHLDMRVDALSDNGVARLQCRCAPRAIAGLVAMTISEVAPEADAGPDRENDAGGQRLSLQQIMELIKSDLGPPDPAGSDPGGTGWPRGTDRKRPGAARATGAPDRPGERLRR